MASNALFGSRWLVWLVVAWGIATAAPPRLAEAAPLPPARGAEATGELRTVAALIEQRAVRARLAEIGVSDAEAAALWERLTPGERAELAARVDEAAAGGSAAGALAAAIILAMLVILILELMGRRVISRP